MGVSGSGKSTFGEVLAARLGVRFVDADALHPAANVEKMSAGIPLDETDRRPWLAAVGRVLATGDVVVACSALRRSYRDAFRAAARGVVFVHLDVPGEVLQSRLEARPGHFMPASLLGSQLAALEPPQPDERALVVDGTGDLEQGVRRAEDWLAPLLTGVRGGTGGDEES